MTSYVCLKYYFDLKSKMLISCKWILCAVFVLQILGGNGYPSGAPYGTCLTMYPHHGSVHQPTPCPIKLHVDKATYRPNEELTVIVKSDDNDSYKGIEMRVHRVSGNTEEMLGEFTNYSSDKLQTQSCFFGKNNLVTHRNNESVTNVTVTWKAPDHNVGDIQFTATIVKDYKTFWFGVKVVVQAESATALVGPSFQLPNISDSFDDISLTECGKSKGCFLHPPSCTGNDCGLGVTYKQNQDKTYSFEMFGPSEGGAGWVGLGISEDRLMGSDQAFVCAVLTDYVGIQYSFNPARYTVQELTQGYSDVETKLADGKIYCRFTRDKLSTIDHKGPMTFDLGKTGYLHLAHGLTYGDLGQPKKHMANPVISYKPVLLHDSGIQYNIEGNGAQSQHSLSALIIIFAMSVASL